MKHFVGTKRLILTCLIICLIFISYYMSCQKKGLVDPSQSTRENTVIISKISSDWSEVNIGGETANISALIIDGNRKPAQNPHVNFFCNRAQLHLLILPVQTE